MNQEPLQRLNPSENGQFNSRYEIQCSHLIANKNLTLLTRFSYGFVKFVAYHGINKVKNNPLFLFQGWTGLIDRLQKSFAHGVEDGELQGQKLVPISSGFPPQGI